MDKIAKWIRRPQVWGFFLSVVVMVIVSLAFFWPDNIDGNTLMQSDTQQGIANGQEAKEYYQQTGEKALWTNSLFSGMPTFQISPTYPSNSLFLWLNKLYSLWLPSPSDLLFMMMLGGLIFFYCIEVRWYYALLGAIAWGFSSYFVIIIGAGHIWKFMALTYIPPTIGGLVLCYRGRYLLGGAMAAIFAMLQLNANHPQMTYYFAFVMAGFAIAYLCDAIRHKTLLRWWIATGVMCAAGVLAVGANLPSLYNTYEYSKETKRAQSELAIADAQAAPEAAAERPTGGLPKQEIVYWSYGREEMLSLLIPNIKGGASAKPEKGKMLATGLDKVAGADEAPYDIKPMLPFFSQYFNEGEGTNGPVYVGAIICALFLLGAIIVRGPIKWVLLVLTLLSVLLALGRNFAGLTDWMIYNFPMYSKFRAVESILVVAEFTMPVLAVMGLAQCLKDTVRVNYMRELNIAFGFVAAICLVVWIFPSIMGEPLTSQDVQIVDAIQQYNPDADIQPMRIYDYIGELRLSMVSADALRALLFVVAAYLLLMMCIRRKFNPIWAVLGTAALVLIDLFGVDKRYIDHESFIHVNSITAMQNDPFKPDATDQAIYAAAGNDAHYRVMDIPGFGNARRSYFHEMIGGYHAAKLNRYEDLIQNRMAHVMSIGYRPELRDPEVLAMLAPDQQATAAQLLADYKVLDMLNTRYVINKDQAEPVANPYALGNAWLVPQVEYVANARQEMDALSTIDPATLAVADEKYRNVLGEKSYKLSADDYIKLDKYSPNTLEYTADTRDGGIAVFSEVYFPWGWHATIDGEETPIARVDYVLRAIDVPAGKHQIVMTFDPVSLHVTSTIAYICIILIYLWLIAALVVGWLSRQANGIGVHGRSLPAGGRS